MAIANKKKSSKKNPLYVVTNEGKDVETAESLWDALVKKFNLQPAIDLLMVMVEIIAKQINSYAALVWLNEELTKVNAEIDRILKKVAPWLYFYHA
jgi:hypothetical protein